MALQSLWWVCQQPAKIFTIRRSLKRVAQNNKRNIFVLRMTQTQNLWMQTMHIAACWYSTFFKLQTLNITYEVYFSSSILTILYDLLISVRAAGIFSSDQSQKKKLSFISCSLNQFITLPFLLFRATQVRCCSFSALLLLPRWMIFLLSKAVVLSLGSWPSKTNEWYNMMRCDIRYVTFYCPLCLGGGP